MKRTGVVVLVLSLSATVSSSSRAQDGLEFTLEEADSAAAKATEPKRAAAVDTSRALQDALGSVRWGMSKGDLLKVLKAQLRAEFERRIKVERDVLRQDALYQEAQEHYRRISENFVAFDGQRTGWDVSPVGREFTHGNREGMLVVQNKGSRDLYFFIQGKLWKWFRELSPEAVDAGDPDEAVSMLAERFGKGKPQLERRNEDDTAYAGKTWSDGSTRATVLRRGGDVCFILEDEQTLGQLRVLRHNVSPKAGKDRVSAAIEAVLLDPNAPK